MKAWLGIGWAQPVTRRRYAFVSMLAQRGYFLLDRMSAALTSVAHSAFEKATT